MGTRANGFYWRSPALFRPGGTRHEAQLNMSSAKYF